MKKAVKIGGGILVALLLVVAVVFLAVSLWPVAYSAVHGESVAANWGLYLAGNREEMYYARVSADNVLGDGPRLTVYAYEDFAAIEDAVAWQAGRDEGLERQAEDVLNRLETDADYLPDWDMEYLCYSQAGKVAAGSSPQRLYLFYMPALNTLYVIESF